MKCYYCEHEWQQKDWCTESEMENNNICPYCNRKILDFPSENIRDLFCFLDQHSTLCLYADKDLFVRFLKYEYIGDDVDLYINAIEKHDLSLKIYEIIQYTSVEKRIKEKEYLYSLSTLSQWDRIVDDFIHPFRYYFYFTSLNQTNEQEWYDGSGGIYTTDKKKLIRYIGKSSSEYKILDGTLVIANNTFRENSSLNIIYIPDSVVLIGDMAFYSCAELNKIKTYRSLVNNELTDYVINQSIGDNVFAMSFKLETIILPYKIKYIRKNVFHENLKNLILPQNLKMCSFLNLGRCKELKNFICESVAFTTTDEIFYHNERGLLFSYWAKSEFYQIPSIINMIASYAFYCNQSLKCIIIHEDIHTILNYAFWNCCNLEYIQLLSSNVDIGEYAFHEYVELDDVYEEYFPVINKLKAIIIPKGSYNYYKQYYDLEKYFVESDRIATCYSDFETIVNESKEKVILPKVHLLNFHTKNQFEEQHYDEYKGSYAQDEMGYSDDDIDTIFDGNPDAYWNID